MRSEQIIEIIRESASMLGQDFDGLMLSSLDASPRDYITAEIAEFRRDLTEAANKQRIIYLENSLNPDEFRSFLGQVEIPIIAFLDAEEEDNLTPVIFFKEKKKNS